VEQALALVGPSVTVALVLTRPRFGPRLRITPAIAAFAGVTVMLVMRTVQPIEILHAAQELWRPFLGVASIMITAAVAERVGLLERAAHFAEKATNGPVWLAFGVVFALSAAVASTFNNDAAILVLTPIIVRLVRRRYPQRPYLTMPFAFAVFAAAGVAPLVISNPINLVVSSHAGIGFNEYAAIMIPVAAAGLVAAFVALCFCFRKEITDNTPARGPASEPRGPLRRAEKLALLVMGVGLGMYPVVSFFDGPVWAVAFVGAAAGIWVCRRYQGDHVVSFTQEVAWDVLLFLLGVFVMAQGLRATGAVGYLTSLYGMASSTVGQVSIIGVVSALGSAVLNNHPMAIMNAVAIDDLMGRSHPHVLAALIGGDLGPRLLPIGSLAGLLWMRVLQRDGLELSIRQFVRVGVTLTIPALTISLAVLLWLT